MPIPEPTASCTHRELQHRSVCALPTCAPPWPLEGSCVRLVISRASVATITGSYAALLRNAFRMTRSGPQLSRDQRRVRCRRRRLHRSGRQTSARIDARAHLMTFRLAKRARLDGRAGPFFRWAIALCSLRSPLHLSPSHGMRWPLAMRYASVGGSGLHGRARVAAITRPVSVAVGQARLRATARGWPQTLQRDSRNAQAIRGQADGRRRRDRRRFDRACRDLGCGALAASDDHLPDPLRALITRTGRARARRGADTFGLDGRARRLEHLVTTAAELVRLVSARLNVPLAAHAENLVRGRVRLQTHRMGVTRARRAERQQRGTQPPVRKNGRAEDAAQRRVPYGGCR
jgi:hypothetical protein